MKTVTFGAERFLETPPPSVKGTRIGWLTNPSGVDRQVRTMVNFAAAHPNLNLTTLYGPEHGVRGEAQAGEHVGADTDPVTGLPVHSLYGETRTPTAEMLESIDVMVIDIQDIGVRYATYLSTAALVISACAEHDKHVILLDRPNPLGGSLVAGNVLDPAFASFVGTHALPTVHGLTIGEFGRLWARDHDLPAPEVITMGGWERDLWYDQTGLPWVFPSPNLPTLDSVTLYPALCLFEGTNLSEGRGTTRPFEVVGAPWIEPEQLAAALRDLDLAGVLFRPITFVPTFSKHQGVACHGVQVHIADRLAMDGIALGVRMVETIRTLYPDDFSFRQPTGTRYFIDLLAGTDELRRMIDAGDPVDALLARWSAEAAAFSQERADILLY